MSDIGKIEQLTTVTSGHSHLTMASGGWTIAPPTISLAEHDRTMDALVQEIAMLKRERVHTAAVLEAFRDAKLSISSVQPVLELADALCGPKEMVCPPLS